MGGEALNSFLFIPQTPEEDAQHRGGQQRGKRLRRQPGALPAVSPVSMLGLKRSRNISTGTRHLKLHLTDTLKTDKGLGASGGADGLGTGTEHGSAFWVTWFAEKRTSGNRADLGAKISINIL